MTVMQIRDRSVLRHIVKHTKSGTGPNPVSPMIVSWAMFSVSIIAFLLHFLMGGSHPVLGFVLDVTSLVTCGLGWLLARALFRDQTGRAVSWPVIVVACLFVASLALKMFASVGHNPLLDYLAIIASLIGSAVLFMTLLEAIDGLDRQEGGERRFRLSFAAGYAAILGASFIVRLDEFLAWQAETQATLALMALIGATIATGYRLRHPRVNQNNAVRRKPSDRVRNPELANRIERLLRTEQTYLDADLRVADLSRRLNEPGYKISTAIVHDLGYGNFNQMMNVYRVQEAKMRLGNSRHEHQSILTIAMDCGFASIGPFNRAFKAHTGLTPSAYRKGCLASSVSD